jgi:hypothetical protein
MRGGNEFQERNTQGCSRIVMKGAEGRPVETPLGELEMVNATQQQHINMPSYVAKTPVGRKQPMGYKDMQE